MTRDIDDTYMCWQVTTLLLDKMRRIKNRMVRLKTRVETIRELLEKFLEDEGDMKSMNLTARYSHSFLHLQVHLVLLVCANTHMPTYMAYFFTPFV